MATSKNKKFDPGFAPVDLVAEGKESFTAGQCELKRVDSAGEVLGEQTLVLVFNLKGWGYSLNVDMGEDVPEFSRKTPWEEILKEPVESKFMWLGKAYKASVRLGGGGTAVVEVREPSGAGSFKKTPFAWYCVKLEGWKEEPAGKPAVVPGAVYAVSVASYYGDGGELTSICDAFGSAEEAADWFERDWNDQAAAYGGKKLGKAAKEKFLKTLQDRDGIADAENPPDWGAWFKWHAVRKTV